MSHRKYNGLFGDAPDLAYTEALKPDADVMTVEEYLNSVRATAFTDYDGFGQPVRDGRACRVMVLPSDYKNGIPTDATHIVWFNR